MTKKKELGGLFMKIRGRLSKSVAHIVPPDEIEDIVQETYVRICQFEEKHHINYPRTFMLKTARNLALDHVKRAESVLADGAETEDDFNVNRYKGWDNEPLQRSASNNEFELFCKAVRTLPRQCRKAFVLKKVYGYSHKEVAERLNISDRTVEKHVATGITRCGRYMNKHTNYGKKVGLRASGSSMNNDRAQAHRKNKLRDEE